MTDDLAQKFIATFRKGIEAEKASLRQDSAAYEVPLEHARHLTEMTEGDLHYYSFVAPRPSDRLSPGVQCNLREASGLEIPTTLVQVDGSNVTLKLEAVLALGSGDHRLVFVPWFLYDAMSEALSKVSFPETALRAFGKLPVQNLAATEISLAQNLNVTQQRAVQQAVSSQLTMLWGPPGTGKTTTLAEIVANLVRLGRRILIASTTHAALDQVLEKLVGLSAIADQQRQGKVVRLGFSGGDTFGCSLGEVVGQTLEQARIGLEESLVKLANLKAQEEALLPVYQQCELAAHDTQQLDLFSEQLGSLTPQELSPVFSTERAAALGAQTAEAQFTVLQRRQRRLKFLLERNQAKARAARLTLTQGQQAAVDGAQIVMSTLANISVSPLMINQEFDCAIIEEAGMALLPTVYLAAGRSRSQVVVVGDPQQLPAILSTKDKFAQQALGRNIFEVLGQRPELVMLDIQYRMHPKIGELVNGLFYNGALKHAAEGTQLVAERAPFAGEALVLVDCAGLGRCQTEPGDYSRCNLDTAALAVKLALEAVATGSNVAIITPYRKQVRTIQALLDHRNIPVEQVQCATVHRFQGNERDVVILDIVDGPPLAPGTLLCGRGPNSASANLLNVSLSRARGKLILLMDVQYVRGRARGTVLCQVLGAALQGGACQA
jgi:hypothetical protein